MSENTDANAAPESETPSKPPLAGHIREMGILDLRSAKTPEDLKGITRISEVGCILIPETLATTLTTIPMSEVGSIVPVPEGENIKTQVGQIRLSGEALAAGDPAHILFIIGQVFLTSQVTSVGYKELWVHGQLFAQRGSEGPLGAKLTRMNGQNFYLPADSRILMGEERIGQEFLDLLPRPQCLVIMGALTFEDDVTTEMLKAKVPEIVLMGVIRAPAAILPLVKVLTVEKMGDITATE